MTAGIGRTPDADGAAEPDHPGPLAGVRVAVQAGAPGADALRAAGARLSGDDADAWVMTGTAAGASAAAGVTPTAAVLGAPVTVAATDLDLGNRVLAILAAHRPAAWPADLRLAAPAQPVVAADPSVPSAVTSTLAAAGALVVALPRADAGTAPLPDGVDVVVFPGCRAPAHGCAVTVDVGSSPVSVLARAFDDAVALDIAATLSGAPAIDRVWPVSAADAVELVVFGAHLRGGALAYQLTELGARWAGEVTTTARYRMTVLPTDPPKPAINRVPDNAPGTALYGQSWLMSAAALGRFLAALPPPMQLGKVEIADGSWRTGFGCDAAAATGVDISAHGGWPAAIAAGAVRGAGRP
ncbi:hypothetical protein JDV09_04440 [Mycobacterium sp. Y57]|uniref:allophanate hydrolase-related protein n=1 Tax=Mycolicibacterium xanthum TaxID=2796469 RepID=UPI001C850209|nr:hypothetical protein [Mycolicibacterium xanthum]